LLIRTGRRAIELRSRLCTLEKKQSGTDQELKYLEKQAKLIDGIPDSTPFATIDKDKIVAAP
jgi:hypothetical protein